MNTGRLTDAGERALFQFATAVLVALVVLVVVVLSWGLLSYPRAVAQQNECVETYLVAGADTALTCPLSAHRIETISGALAFVCRCPESSR